MKLKILSWNIWNGKYLPEIIEFLQKADADIIGLQEVIQDINGENNVAQAIAEKLGYNWVFKKVRQYPQDDGRVVDWGNAVLSKYPITNSVLHLLSEEETRAALQADIQINESILHIFSVHLVHTHQQPSDIQNLQADALLNILPKERTILMGDFNAVPDSYPVQKAQEVLVATNIKNIPTWSVYVDGCKVCKLDTVQLALDYLFSTQDVVPTNFSVGDSKGSDHLPISIEIEV